MSKNHSRTSKSALETILEWSKDRPLWQRDAIRRIVVGGKITQSDIDELFQLCLVSNGNSSSIQASPFSEEHLPINSSQSNSVNLLSISEVANVNSLAPHQVLSFLPDGITLIYGDNGAGKSGYVRILKRNCRARHNDPIKTNAFGDQELIGKPTAKIKFQNGTQVEDRVWIDHETPDIALSAITVFDTDCAKIHLSEKNEVSFRPFGLDIPDELASVCQQIKELLTKEQDKISLQQSINFSQPNWKPTTQVGKALSKLSYKSDLVEIKKLGLLKSTEQIRFDSLKKDIGKDPIKAAQEHREKADGIGRVLKHVDQLIENFSDGKLFEIFDAVIDVKTKRQAAAIVATETFASESLSNIGSESWKLLWESARKFSIQDAYKGQEFPYVDSGSQCVLCLQPINDETGKRLAKFENFVSSDLEQQKAEAETIFKIRFAPIKDAQINTISFRSELKWLLEYDKDVYKKVIRALAIFRLRRYVLMRAFTADSLSLSPEIEIQNVDELRNLIATINNYASDLSVAASASDRQIIESEYQELSDRKLIIEIASDIESEITRLTRLKFISDRLAETNTQTITKLGNDIADQVITSKLRDRFQEEIVKLAADKVRVEIVRSGGKYGSPQYQIKFLANQSAKIATILSEGEQTCVSLAAFLTELATSAHHSALVFDDPVTSLDHKWRDKIAKRLAEESLKRQIIVFTHDITFIHDLKSYADSLHQNPAKIRLVSLKKDQNGAGVATDGLPWIAKSVEDRIDKLEKDCTIAKVFYDNNNEEAYENHCKTLYNNLRATWERAVEDVVFSRVVQRHRDYIETKHLKKVTVFTENDHQIFEDGFKKCCEVTDAHDPSRARNSDSPAPDVMKADIAALSDWVKSIRERQKAIQ